MTITKGTNVIELGGNVFHIPPDTGCWYHSSCLDCPRERCVHDDPPKYGSPEASKRVDEVVRLHENGLSYSAIATQLNVKYSTVTYALLRRRQTKSRLGGKEVNS